MRISRSATTLSLAAAAAAIATIACNGLLGTFEVVDGDAGPGADAAPTGSDGGGPDGGGPDAPSGSDPCATDNGGCAPTATCTSAGGAVTCKCKPLHCGDGRTCQPAPFVRVPTATDFGWQSRTSITAPDPATGHCCAGKAVLAVGYHTACYVGADGFLRCSGKVSARDFGKQWDKTEFSDVDQVLLSGAYDAMCVRHKTGKVECIGENGNGQLGVVDPTGARVTPVTTFTSWGNVANVEAIGTGTWDQLCGRTADGKVLCSGYNFAPTPVTQGQGSRFWVSTFGKVVIDDPNVLRAEDGRTECTITSAGFVCASDTFGTAGAVVNGGQVTRFSAALWLERSGKLFTEAPGGAGAAPLLADVPAVVGVAANGYSDGWCAIGAEGALFCKGTNNDGLFGTGDTTALAAPMRVQPPGSVRLACD